MKGGKDEGRFGGDADKIMGPMFPRLHVNDKEKGGPRAPPRNKMALYEQLSIPAQRFNSALPLAPHITSTLVPSASLSEGGGHERSVFSTFYIPPAPAYSTEKVNSRSSDGMDLNAGLVQFDRKSMKNAGYKMSNIASHLSSTAECSPVRPLEMSNSKDSCRKKLGDDDDFRVPTYANSGIAQSPKDHCGTNSTFTCISSVQLQNAHNRPMKEPNTVDLKSRRSMHHDVENEKNQSEQKPKSTVEIKDGVEKHSCHLVWGEKTVEPSKCVKKILNQEHLSGPTSGCEDLDTESSRFYQESREDNNCGNGVSIDPSRPDEVEIREDGNVSMVRSGTSSRASLGNSNEGLNRAESGDKACSLVQVGDGGKYDDVSETSMLDSMSALDISPDDVVEAIGQKHFWKARRAIVNQQRVFAVQVFELHRLIKVQKLIAGSPHLLLEGNLYSTKPSPKVSSAKKFPSEFVMKAPLQIVKQKPELQNPDPSPSLGNGINEGPVSHISSHGPYSENPSPVPVPADNKAAPWCFHPPGNQWLVPVMSPSEGLIYKPYTGPCPPIASFMAPVYGGCGPLSLPPVPGDVTNPPYGVLASHQQGVAVLSGVPTVPQSYFPLPFGLPVVNPIISGTMQAAALPAERGNPAAGIRSNGQVEQFPTGEINVSMHSGSSCNTSNQKSEAFSCQLQKFGSSKDCEFQGGMPSSARKKVTGEAKQALEGRDVLPLFPMDPTVEALDWQLALGGSEHPGRVIKVVPHNPSSATESAARIFRSIQKERQQF